MRSRLSDSTIVGTANEVLAFTDNILESSTGCSIIGKNIEGKILLWNEGARPAVRVRLGRSSWRSPTLPSFAHSGGRGWGRSRLPVPAFPYRTPSVRCGDSFLHTTSRPGKKCRSANPNTLPGVR